MAELDPWETATVDPWETDAKVTPKPTIAKPKLEKKKEPSWFDKPLTQQINDAVSVPAEIAATLASGAGASTLGNLAAVLDVQRRMATNTHGTGAEPREMRDAIAKELTYQPRTEGAQAFMNGPMAKIGALMHRGTDWLGSKVADPQGPYNPLGAGAAEAATQLPALLLGPGMSAAGGVIQGPAFGARRLMQSALKPEKAELLSGAAVRAVETMFDEGVNATRGGADTLRGRVDVLNGKISDLIANSAATVDKSAVQGRLLDTMDRFVQQVTPMTDLKAIQKAWDEFQTTWPQQIAVQTAQKMKQGTYRELSGKYQGELQSADVAAQQALARGLKEEIAAAIPDVQPLNAAESKLLNVLPMVERRALMDANKNPVGLGIISTSPAHLAMWLADKSALFKSLVARMLNQTGESMQGAAPVAGGAASTLANQPR